MDFSNELSCFFFLMELNAVVLIGLYDMFSLKIIINNLFTLEALMTGLAYASYRAYLAKRETDMYLTKANEVKTEHHALVFLDYLG